MCRYKLQTCPYPHQDPIAALIFLPDKAGQWVPCDEPKPWGRLSCGKLVVMHPQIPAEVVLKSLFPPALQLLENRSGNLEKKEDPQHSETPDLQTQSYADTIIPGTAAGVDGTNDAEGAPIQLATCKWCTSVVKLVATKSKEKQSEARQEIAQLEKLMDGCPLLRQLQGKILRLEQNLDTLRHDALALTRALRDDTETTADNENQTPASNGTH
ncbi:hypothetical protein LTR99_009631 [Exophiala xenobiotica]|uniref:Uncharacterized protein n=1 Tax=Vermiconidia calcicola TaxID=1690605 RepID=A0AAV9PVP4_9PEZI|nr:hypothetical protein LTR92_007790 [Exophiala xenobiotica]KAK5530469.1 hypothetical protein LTR25_009047 [Vermiconidia calcicola]KAK5539090.1 hypothetical protein LTR23_006904 [Chaetothyriales sp. CCFEE 6169]KAK5205473.1 hypothetical protein LTR41_008927 [Exophiala xenobiotica]KAK5272101.1 hypothetical protein LTR96_001731 [Exophiala xenobiotica]